MAGWRLSALDRRPSHVGLDVAPHFPCLILEPPHRGIESVADRNIDVLMGLIDGFANALLDGGDGSMFRKLICNGTGIGGELGFTG